MSADNWPLARRLRKHLDELDRVESQGAARMLAYQVMWLAPPEMKEALEPIYRELATASDERFAKRLRIFKVTAAIMLPPTDP